MKLTFCTLILLAAGIVKAGQEVGNAGDLIVCQKSASNEFNGYYSLDYVLTYPSPEVENVKTWKESLQRIADLIKAKVPELYLSFKTFQNDVLNTSYDKAHVWEQAPFGLVPVDDQILAVKLPPNCLENGKINLIHAVIRLNPDYSGAETQVFKYMPSALDTLNLDRQIQTSFLLVHEWLWELGKNVDRNRRINRYLHSKIFTANSSLQVINQLKGMGLTLTGDAYAFDSIQSSLNSALPNATVWLFDRTYQEKLKISKPVTLKPVGGANPLIVTDEFQIEADNVTIQNLNFNLIKSTSGLAIEGKNINVSGNRFVTTDGSGAGLTMRESSSAVIANNNFESLNRGIVMYKSSTAEIRNNQFTKGIALDMTEAHGKIISNRFTTSWVEVTGSGNPTADGVMQADFQKNVFDQCSPHCLDLRSGANANIDSNQFSNSNSALIVFENSKASILRNQFVSNQTALSIFEQQSQVQVEGNTFTKNQLGIDNLAKKPIGPNKFDGNTKDIEN